VEVRLHVYVAGGLIFLSYRRERKGRVGENLLSSGKYKNEGPG